METDRNKLPRTVGKVVEMTCTGLVSRPVHICQPDGVRQLISTVFLDDVFISFLNQEDDSSSIAAVEPWIKCTHTGKNQRLNMCVSEGVSDPMSK